MCLITGECAGSMPEVGCFECAQRGGGGDVASSMDLLRSADKTEAVAWFVVSDQTPSSSCSRGIDSHTCKLELGLARN